MREYVVTENTTLRRFTDQTDAQASFALKMLLKEREVRVNGERVGADVPLSAGDTVRYYLTPAQEAKRAFSTVYEDENILVADKESGVDSEAVFHALQREGDYRFLHRLDRNTEGLLAFAKNDGAERELLSAFRERRAEKIYHALVFGTPRVHAVEEAHLIKDEAHSLVRIGKQGEKIVTEYEILERRGDKTLLKVTLHTGKTHQIRAHLAYLGYPVVGDEKYGDHKKNAAEGAARQRLLAKSLRFSLRGPLAYLNGTTFVSRKNL